VTALYGDDLAHVHASGYGALAEAAVVDVVPRLRAAGARTVIDVGCGAGVTTRALVEAGFSVLALEPSPALSALARAAAPGADVRCVSVYDADLPPCDAVLAIGEVLSYHPPDVDADARLRAVVLAASRALAAGGHLVFDVIVTGEPSLAARGWNAGPDWAVLVETREDGRELTRAIETFRTLDGVAYRRTREVHSVRTFDEPTIARWLGEAGFDVRVAGAYGSHPLATRRRAFFAVRSGAVFSGP